MKPYRILMRSGDTQIRVTVNAHTAEQAMATAEKRHPGWHAVSAEELPDLFDAKAQRDAALEQVAEPEERNGWMKDALRLLPEAFWSGRDLTGEEVRERLGQLVGMPHHHNVWGALMAQALRRKMIIATGYRHMHGPKSHARKTPTYRLLI
jgi:hypothetical protein